MTPDGSRAQPEETPAVPDSTEPHPSRTYDYLLGGKDNLGADRSHVAENLKATPRAPERVRAQRHFLERAVKHLVDEAGIRQILDIGCGLPMPCMQNVHEIAQRIAPETRVVYVDSNPVATAHMNALQTDGDRVRAFAGDVRDPETILNHPVTRETLDFTQPIGLLLVGLIHFIPDEDEPATFVAHLRDALAPGSLVVVSQMSAELDPKVHAVTRVWQGHPITMVQRGREDIERILDGFEPVEPGIVAVHEWRPDGADQDAGNAYGIVARKP